MKTLIAVNYYGTERTFDELLETVGPPSLVEINFYDLCANNQAILDAMDAVEMLANMEWKCKGRKIEKAFAQRIQKHLHECILDAKNFAARGIPKGGH